ncbi:hypothetical protein [Vibrio alginolyticus]|uniref:hypothetical protein n=1 Tax=Vibrio alginolyticus TaxID=663 RepID=UPI001BD6AA64|nr:hypothetical protein [Vibrio alginolyticus]MDF4599608.1 hypothetical protein [Vibrio parahaemolyticus]MBS9821126.1 hypothetical protein [Vibrio alginolyticus]MDG2679195.1 hypothetical protein [Vibrio parahaemolyticus]HCE1609346.1 hypothetical protein [Vibrio parahaemolyticus]HCE5232310.1 hypothetical protein [Vibrio parahaemolyticus]
MDYEEYEQLAEQQRVKNNQLLDSFEEHLKLEGLSEKTVSKHLSNLDFYVNHYLLYEEIIEPIDGIEEVGYFFEGWFPRKAMWSSPTSVNATITVLKKFYKYLLSQDLITKVQYSELLDLIKESKAEWVSYYEPMDSGW